MSEESVTHKTIRTSAWGAVQKFSTMGIKFVVTIFLTRLLTPKDYGTIALLSIFFAVANSIAECGFANALVRKKKCTQEDYSTAFFYNFGVSVLLYAVLFFCSPLIARFYDTPILTAVLRVSGLSLIIQSFNLTQSVQLTRKLEAKKFAIIASATSILSGFIGIFFAYQGFGVWALVIQSLSQTLATTMLFIYFVRWKPTWSFSESSFKYLWGFGSKMLVTGLISTLYANIYSLVIGKVYDTQDLGLFNRGQSTSNIFPSIMCSIFLGNALPILSQIRDDHDYMLNVYRKFTKLVTYINVPVCAILAALAEPFVLCMFTEKWIAVVPYIQIFCIAAALEPVGQLNLMIFQVEGRSDITLKVEIIKKAIGFLLVFILCHFGPLILALGSTTYLIFAYSINLFYVNKLENISYTRQLRDLLPFFVSAIVAAGASYLINFFNIASLLKLIIGGFIGSICYLLFTKYVFHSDIHDRVFQLLKQRILSVAN